MKVFITGATGYIGHGLTVRLLEAGHEVHALCRNHPDHTDFHHPHFHLHIGDLCNLAAVVASMEGCEAVFHLAALAKVWMPEPGEFYNVNVTGMEHVLNAANACGVRKVVFTSSAAVYGESNGRPVEEDDVRRMNFFTDYESSKFIAEERVQHYVRKGLDVVIVQPTKVYGPGILTESNALSQIISHYVQGDWHIIPGDGKMIGNFSFIDDVVNGHILAQEQGRSGEKYILGGINASFNEFFARLKGLSQKSYVTVHLPKGCMMLYAWQEEFLARVFGREPRITRPWVRKYNRHLACSSDKAVRELGYKITSLDDGLNNTLDWISNRLNVIY